MTLNDMCPCKSGTSFSKCCSGYLNTEKFPPNPLTLMRSRYSAYVLEDIDYLVKTQCDVSEREEIAAFAKAAYFQHLEILEYEGSFVEFKAYYVLNHHQELLHERSFFISKNEQWCYKEGELFSSNIVFKRNEACICGSGKKYKRCCALL